MTENIDSSKYQLNFPTMLYKEGATSFYIPDLNHYKADKREYLPSKLPVFFNPRMEIRRDISILTIKTFKTPLNKDISFCEPLSSSGVMGIRVANELNGVTVYLNDINKKAIELAKKSIAYNNLDNIFTFNDEAKHFLIDQSKKIKRFDVIDVDPFGTPAPFISAALMALRRGGLLFCTATDMPPLVGIHLKACIRKYASVPLKTEYAHETAVRILIGFIARQVANSENGIQVLLSYSTDHYIQIFIKLKGGINLADECLEELGYIGHCFNCENRFIFRGLVPEISKECPICKNKIELAGPLWLGELSNVDFCETMLKNLDDFNFNTKIRIQKIIECLIQENNGLITYHDIHKICKKFHLNIPPIDKILISLKKANYKVSRTHFSPKAIRTDAKRENIAQIIRELQN